MSRSVIPPLLGRFPIIDPKTGNPTLPFCKVWQDFFQNEAGTNTVATDAAALAGDAVPQSRVITTIAPITGGQDLSTDVTIGHGTSGVTAGSYTSANITVDADGHVTAATNGSGSGIAAVPTIIQKVLLCTSSGAGTVTLGAAPTAGHILVAIGARWTGVITTSAGWTRLADQVSASSDVGVIFWKLVVAGESATQTFSPAVSGWDMVVYELSGTASSAFYAYAAVASIAAATSIAINAGVPSSVCVTLGMFMCQGGTDTFTLSGATSDGTASDASATNGGGRSIVAFHSTPSPGAWQPSATITGAKVNGYAYMVIGGIP